MPSYSGTITSSQGTRTLDVTPNDVITFTPTSGTYTVEYPIGTVAISGASTAQSITSTTSATQMRVTCLTGSVAYANVDGIDNTSVLTPTAAAAASAVVSGASMSAAANAVAASAAADALVQSLGAKGGVIALDIPGVVQITESILIPNNATVKIGAGVTLLAAPGNNRSMFRASNVRFAYDGAAVALVGFQALYADTSATIGTGTLAYTNAGTTLTWTAPGDTAGTPVNISTPGYYRIPSGTPGRALYVLAPSSAERPAGNASASIYVSTIKGAEPVTLSVTSNVLTAVETAHGRQAGDMVEVYRDSTGAAQVVQLLTATTNGWTAAWTIANFTAESGRVHGVRNIGIVGPGVIDQNRATQTNGVTIERFPFQLQNVTKMIARGWTLRNALGQGFRCRNSCDWMVDDLFGENVQNLLQLEGPADRISIGKIVGQSAVGDDVLAFTQTAIGAGGSYTSYATHQMGVVNASIGSVQSDNASGCALKITGFTGSVFNIDVGSIKGSGASAAILAVVDTASLTGGAIGRLTVGSVDWTATGGLNVGEIMNFTMTGGASSIEFNAATWNGTSLYAVRLASASGVITNLKFNGLATNNSPTNPLVQVSQAVTNLSLNNCSPVLGAGGSLVTLNSASANITNLSVQGGSFTGSTTNTRIVYQITGTITNASFGGGLYCASYNALFRNESTASNGAIVNVNQVTLNGLGTGINLNYTGGTVTVNLGQIRATSIGNNLIQDAASTVTVVNCLGTVNFTGFGNLFLGSGTSRTVSGLQFSQAPAFSATPTWRLSNGNNVRPAAATGNVTVTLADIPPAGERGAFVLTQDATGTRAFTLPASVKFATGALVSGAAATANQVTTIPWVSDGTNLIVPASNTWF